MGSTTSKGRFPLLVALCAIGLVAGGSGHTRPGPDTNVATNLENTVDWYNLSTWALEGKGWVETDSPFARVPAKAKGRVRDWIWKLGHHTAGLVARFESDASAIWVRYELSPEALAKPGMPATGKSGLDFYAQDDTGRWRWLGVVQPTSHSVSKQVFDGIDPGRRAYMMYLPLRNGVESLEIGVPAGTILEPAPPRKERPLVFYGTSITQGTAASRPGMAYPAILGRRLARPVINLGSSGNGVMELDVGSLIVELDAAVYVIDCLPNMTADQVAERTEPLVRQLRKGRPAVPIVLVEERHYDDAVFLAAHRERHAANNTALKAAYDRLVSAGMTDLYYVEGKHLLGDDGDGSAYGGHPSDLGMMRIADVLESVLRPLLVSD